MGKLARAAVLLAATIAPLQVLADEPHTIVVENMRFQPDDVVVKTGERIVWVNKDLVPHTATAGDGSFDSGVIAPGQSWVYTATKSGVHAYACTFHPSMIGKVTVR